MRQEYISKFANDIYNKTCRSDFKNPGFYLLDLGKDINSKEFRTIMVEIKNVMAKIHKEKKSKTLIYLSAGRFNQQENTKPHLDGGPKESLLMLGYEPSEIDSKLEIIDYSKCAFDNNLSPEKFLDEYNPMFDFNLKKLQAYTTAINSFNKTHYQIVCINNSFASYNTKKNNWQGVLHNAKISNPSSKKQRIINSTLIAPSSINQEKEISKSEIDYFINTSEVKQKL